MGADGNPRVCPSTSAGAGAPTAVPRLDTGGAGRVDEGGASAIAPAPLSRHDLARRLGVSVSWIQRHIKPRWRAGKKIWFDFADALAQIEVEKE